ncbi:conserved hypothetical protein, steroid delta-isomerase-related [Geodermatophilus saharensis]|uniref:SnoaL-like domain-containing protein n=1 Tax=Geodermatophilus saharensis TaxID=1137994 RepID=A0A239A4K5_9ACTN|nr:ester cyclase [Geodermatophilus saharensis]SNR90587.1 conserved hypothetical protein, steroid delta-isomerase-related [Geodermatophilus saharensis]
MTGQPVDPKAFILGVTEVFNQHDPDRAAAFYAEDAEVVNHGTGRRVVGRAAIREDLAALMAAADDLRIEKTVVVGDGDVFADEFLLIGTHTGPLAGIPATGRPFRLAHAAFGWVRDGRIVRHHLHWNPADLFAQLGVVPGEAPAVPAGAGAPAG